MREGDILLAQGRLTQKVFVGVTCQSRNARFPETPMFNNHIITGNGCDVKSYRWKYPFSLF